jgi:hypothetical protein
MINKKWLLIGGGIALLLFLSKRGKAASDSPEESTGSGSNHTIPPGETTSSGTVTITDTGGATVLPASTPSLASQL